jgi:hypothetical protein
VATVEVFIRDNKDGTLTLVAPTGWRKWRGPSLIGLGLVIGLVGNIASLWVQ